MSRHKCVWTQTCVGTIVSGHKRVGSSMYGHNRVVSSMYGHNRVVSASHDPFVAVINETFSNSYAKGKYHGGGTHWICVSNIPSIISGNEGNASVGIFDSISRGCTTDDVTSFIKKIYDDGEVECVDNFKVQHQYDGWSCGAIMDLLLENDPYDTVMDVEKCARHVAFCLEKQVSYEFPSFKRNK